jgi:hypothetical protein
MQRKVVSKRVVSSDGKVIAETYSEVITSDSSSQSVHQSIRIEVSSDGKSSCYSHSSGSAGTTENS